MQHAATLLVRQHHVVLARLMHGAQTARVRRPLVRTPWFEATIELRGCVHGGLRPQ